MNQKMPANKELTIIILSYNSSAIISQCLSHLNFDKYEVVVVDNASSDKTVEIVAAKFPQAQILKLEKNIGYGRGNNVALKEVKTEFALVMNPDSIMLEEDIDVALTEIKKFPQVVNAGPVVLRNYPLNNSEFAEKIKMMDEDFHGIKDCYWEKLGDNYSVRFVVGAALFLRVNLLKEVGYFDENIFMYYEDDELCKRVRDHGYKAMIVTSCKAFHIGGESSQKSLRALYKKYWHLSWSKMYWKGLQKGEMRCKRSAFKFAVTSFSKAILFLITLQKEEAIKSCATAAGAVAFSVGLGAFKNNGESRG